MCLVVIIIKDNVRPYIFLPYFKKGLPQLVGPRAGPKGTKDPKLP